ncbi:terminase large subunit domain-containing protein [Photobacterium sp. GB-72]|uniref:terminase large subunit domain-containing protein n=1 Tax=Photobacterium sp. GB-72 TaxID=2022105 RepID=UPI000D16C8A1|nr:terminase family protein [Photobacterium sp. GB-72]PSV30329.1 hypothetical protein C9J40_13685 [Photobacterium sp. GB-72]
MTLSIDNKLKTARKYFQKSISNEDMSNHDFMLIMQNYVDSLGDSKFELYEHVKPLEHGVLNSPEKLRKVFPMAKVNVDRYDIGNLHYKNKNDEYRFNKKPDYKSQDFKLSYSVDHVMEYMRCLDPLYFIKEYCYLKHVTHGLVKFIPRKYQETQLRLMQFERNTVFAMSRQVGKTQTASGYAAHYVTFNPFKSVGIVADSLSKAENMLRMIMLTIGNLPDWIQPEIVSMSKSRIEFANGSSIQAFASREDSMRGFQCSVVFIDEAAFIDGFKETFSLTIEPTLSSGDDTKCIIFSTPNGNKDINYFAEMFDLAGDCFEDGQESKNGFIRYRVNWQENPENLFFNRSDKKKSRWNMGIRAFKNDKVFDNGKFFKASKLAKNGNSLSTFEREYETSFNVANDTLISGDVLMTIDTHDPSYVPVNYKTEGMNFQHTIRMFRNVLDHEKLVLSADVARGVGHDYSAFIVYSHDHGDVVATFADKNISIACYANLIVTTANFFNKAMIIVELNKDGHLLSYKLEKELKYKHLFKSDFKKGDSENKVTTGIEHNQNKNRGCKTLKAEIESSAFIFYDVELLNELKAFIEVSPDVFKSVGHHDDLTMACVTMMTARDNSSYYQMMSTYHDDRIEDTYEPLFIGMSNGINEYSSFNLPTYNPDSGIMASGYSGY